jgi:hypothetical protein
MRFRAWEILPSETSAEFEAFSVFRDLGPSRNYSQVAGPTGHKYDTVATWARKHDWAARCRAWDVHLDALRRKEFEQAQRAVIQAHVDVGAKVRDKAMRALGKVTVEQLAKQPRVALAMLEAAVRIEQQALGLPTGGIEQPTSGEPTDAYFASLEPDKLLDLGRTAVEELQRLTAAEVRNG